MALVVGNSAYPQAPLRNPRNDAEAFASKLKSVSPAFDVTVALDVGRDAMEDALERFESKLGACDTALLFFAGHGLQVKGINYLMPVDADIRQEIHLKRRAISLNEILEIMGRRVRQSSLIFLDACRDNPFARSLLAGLPDDERGRFLTRSGLAEVRAGAGSFVAFATAPDNVALDGAGSNSPFTEALLRHIELPGASINDVMIAVRRDVLKATGGRQEPWDQSSLRERFCFHNVIETVVPPLPPPESHLTDAAIFERAAIEHWELIKGTTDPARLRYFLANYGTSRMGQLARDALQGLATAAWGKVGKRDEAELSAFVALYPGTQEIAEASALLTKAQEAGVQAAAASNSKDVANALSIGGDSVATEVDDWSKTQNVLAASCAIMALPVTMLLCGVWKTKGKALFGEEDRIHSGFFIGGLATSAAAITLARWRGHRISGLEIALYWLVFAVPAGLMLSGLLRGMAIANAQTANFLGCIVGLTSGLHLIRRRQYKLRHIELALYWIGASMCLVVAARDSENWLQLSVLALSAAVGVRLLWDRRERVRGDELAIYWLGISYFIGDIIEKLVSIAGIDFFADSISGPARTGAIIASVLVISSAACLTALRKNSINHLEAAVYWTASVFQLQNFLNDALNGFAIELIDDSYSTASVLWGLATVALAFIWVKWRSKSVSSIEIPIYWLVCCLSVSTALSALFSAYDLSILGDGRGRDTGAIVAACLSVASALYLGMRNRKKISDAEVAIYWLGSGWAFGSALAAMISVTHPTTRVTMAYVVTAIVGGVLMYLTNRRGALRWN